MTRSTKLRRVSSGIAVLALAAAGLALAQPVFAASNGVAPGDPLFVNPQSTTLQSAATLTGQARSDAQLLGSFPSASWFDGGTPAQVRAQVSTVVTDAAADGSVPTLVAYNLPFRDCGNYSSGGAANTAAYDAWIDGFAAGIGNRKAIIIVEPDGLGIIPWFTSINGGLDSCQPAEANPATAASDRFAQLNHAVDALTGLSKTSVYLDGTHSGWLGVGDITDRLVKAGVAKTAGFFLNASNYVPTNQLAKYGTWISDCQYLVSHSSWYQASYCGSQYYPANPNDFSTWGLTDAQYTQAFSDTGLTQDASKQLHFVIDTSRNGQGAWNPPSGTYSDAQVWCNPPGAGLGTQPTTSTGNALIDAYLWIKVPGESDGQCTRGTAGPGDPARGVTDPAAGAWFASQARELIVKASPTVAAPGCKISYTINGTWPNGFNTQVWITNTAPSAITGWKVKWAFPNDEKINDLWSGSYTQSGQNVAVSNLSWNSSIASGAQLTFGFTGTGTAKSSPLLFTVNGKPCTS